MERYILEVIFFFSILSVVISAKSGGPPVLYPNNAIPLVKTLKIISTDPVGITLLSSRPIALLAKASS
jgi:hypothetical protein